MPEFHIVSPYRMAGDQPQAVAKLVEGIRNGLEEQTLKGVTGSGKTFTMANIIEQTQRPTLVLAHNKTLAAQLCTELREFFPDNAVEYFVSYYDYYQPEAYIASTDTYIEKDSAINDEIDRLRHSATSALAERRDVIIVSSVSCIYSLGDPIDYKSMVISLRPGMELSRDTLIRRLIDIQYERNDIAFERNRFRVRGDTVEIWPVYSDEDVVRIEFFGDEVDRISRINPLTGVPLGELSHIAVFPASHYVTPKEKLEEAIKDLEEELEQRVRYFEENGKLIEAQRIAQRTRYDIEMLQEIGFCSGIENYSRVLSRRAPGSSPYTLIDYFPKDFLLIVDESHVTLPQVRAMYHGDRARKESLVENGFRLPSAYDNRPLNFDEFNDRLNQIVYVSATPGEYELSRSGQVVEQVIRPTGLLDPEVVVRPVDGQIDDLIGEINARTARSERVLVTTLTKKMAEDLTDYLDDYPYLKENVGPFVNSMSFSGQIIGIPRRTLYRAGGMLLREDWLETLNLEVPQTLDDFYNVFYQFTYGDPDGNGVDDTTGLALFGGPYVRPLMLAAGIEYDYYVDEATQTVKNFCTDPNF